MPRASTRLAASWVGEALQSRRFLVTAWPWRVAAHVLTTTALLVALMLPVLLAMAPLVAALESGDGAARAVGLAASLALLALVLVLTAPAVARLELARLRLVDRRPRPYIAEPADLVARWTYRLTQRPAWLRVVYLATLLLAGTASVVVLVTALGLGLALLTAPLTVAAGGQLALGPWAVATPGEARVVCLVGPPVLAAAVYLCGAASAVHVLLARLLLTDPVSRYEERLGQLTRSRARLVHGFDAERRRIERDLHDVAQQRVVTLTMQLGLARLDLDELGGSEHPATRAVATAHDHATELMGELRALIHGIHPQVLTDLGVGAAVDHLASTMPLPVVVRDDLGARPASHVESTLYFCLSEALSNAARHSGASRVSVSMGRRDRRVVAEVWDDGHGGADPTRGSGLAGIVDRAAVLDGDVRLSSPPGGPTSLRISLPDDPPA